MMQYYQQYYPVLISDGLVRISLMNLNDREFHQGHVALRFKRWVYQISQISRPTKLEESTGFEVRDKSGCDFLMFFPNHS